MSQQVRDKTSVLYKGEKDRSQGSLESDGYVPTKLFTHTLCRRDKSKTDQPHKDAALEAEPLLSRMLVLGAYHTDSCPHLGIVSTRERRRGPPTRPAAPRPSRKPQQEYRSDSTPCPPRE